MEKNNNINIAEILKDCPEGMKLYSPLLGEVKLGKSGSDNISIFAKDDEGREIFHTFKKKGFFYSEYPETECLLLPSSKMRDWTKFFKRGDVVYSSSTNTLAIFEGWANSYYTDFKASIFRSSDGIWREGMICITGYFVKVDRNSHDEFIADAEEHYNGKYNPDTLQVEPVKPECPFKPFDKVLVRDGEEDTWYANYFSHYGKGNTDYPYICIDSCYHCCIPYNEHTAHLLGTTDQYTEGGSE